MAIVIKIDPKPKIKFGLPDLLPFNKNLTEINSCKTKKLVDMQTEYIIKQPIKKRPAAKEFIIKYLMAASTESLEKFKIINKIVTKATASITKKNKKKSCIKDMLAKHNIEKLAHAGNSNTRKVLVLLKYVYAKNKKNKESAKTINFEAKA